MVIKLESNKIREEGYFYAGCLLSFLIPFNQFISSCVIVLWLVISIKSFKKRGLNINYHLLLPPLLYVLYVTSLLYSKNEAFYIFERKLVLLAFPLIFFLNKYNKKQRLYMLKFFVYGVFISGLFCLFFATYKSLNFLEGQIVFKANVEEGRGFIESVTFGGNYFFGSYLSLFHQTVYFSLYTCIAIVIVLWKKDLFQKKLRIILFSFFLILLFFISNKANLIVICIVILYKVIPYFLKVSFIKKLVVLCSAIVFCLTLFLLNPRMGPSIKKMFEKGVKIESTARYGYGLRLLSWDAAIELIKKSPLYGHGVGDAQDKLNNVYEAKDYLWPLKRSLNAHNEYFQLWIELGAFGVIVFLCMLIVLFKYWTYSNEYSWVLSIFMIFLINAFFESYLNRYSGLLIISFFYCFIISNSNSKNLRFEN